MHASTEAAQPEEAACDVKRHENLIAKNMVASPPRAAREGLDDPARGGGGAERGWQQGKPQPSVLPLARREAGLGWQAGLRAFEWTLVGPACIPFPRDRAVGAEPSGPRLMRA